MIPKHQLASQCLDHFQQEVDLLDYQPQATNKLAFHFAEFNTTLTSMECKLWGTWTYLLQRIRPDEEIPSTRSLPGGVVIHYNGGRWPHTTIVE